MSTVRAPMRAPASTTQYAPTEAPSPTWAAGDTTAVACTPGSGRYSSGRRSFTTFWNAR